LINVSATVEATLEYKASVSAGKDVVAATSDGWGGDGTGTFGGKMTLEGRVITEGQPGAEVTSSSLSKKK